MKTGRDTGWGFFKEKERKGDIHFKQLPPEMLHPVSEMGTGLGQDGSWAQC